MASGTNKLRPQYVAQPTLWGYISLHPPGVAPHSGEIAPNCIKMASEWAVIGPTVTDPRPNLADPGRNRADFPTGIQPDVDRVWMASIDFAPVLVDLGPERVLSMLEMSKCISGTQLPSQSRRT